MLAGLFTEKTLLIVITLVGMGTCALGIGQVAARGEWLHPMSIMAYLVGILILGIAGATLFDIPLLFIDSTPIAIMTVIVLAIVKVGITQIHHAWT